MPNYKVSSLEEVATWLAPYLPVPDPYNFASFVLLRGFRGLLDYSEEELIQRIDKHNLTSKAVELGLLIPCDTKG